MTVRWFSLLASHLREGTFAGAMREVMETNVLCWGDQGLHSLDHLYASKSGAKQILQSSLLLENISALEQVEQKPVSVEVKV